MAAFTLVATNLEPFKALPAEILKEAFLPFLAFLVILFLFNKVLVFS